jgi:hypothetical protein
MLGMAGRAIAQSPVITRVATQVVVLGVTHSGMLVNPRQQPAAFRAFFDEIRPNVIGVERAPEQFARNDHYEFTYEIQEIIVPYAKQAGIPVAPFDWLPAPEDPALAFGIADLEQPPFLRPSDGSGLNGFLSFSDSETRAADFFYADAEEVRAKNRQWYVGYPDKPRLDFPRRLYLYRTFMQAMRIAQVAARYPGGRVLVVVGDLHKDDLERILSEQRGLQIVQPSTLVSALDAEKIRAHIEPQDRLAVATFNLLGVQSRSGQLDLVWLKQIMEELAATSPGAELELLKARFDELSGRIQGNAAFDRYQRIVAISNANSLSTWSGVKDRMRIDSYFDPFGALTIRQRARTEAARVAYALGRGKEGDALKIQVRSELISDLKRAQFDGYWERYIRSKP